MPKKVRKSQSEEWDQSSSNGHTSRGTSTPRSRASRRSSLEDEDQLSADQTKMTSDRLQSALAEAAEDPIIRLIKDSVDNLGEKRASTREQALTTLMRSLSMRCTDEVEETIEGRQETIITHLKRSIRRDASDRECVMACRVVVMMSALLHLQDECGWYSDVTGRLSAIISYEASDEKQQKQSDESKVAAAALSLTLSTHLMAEASLRQVLTVLIVKLKQSGSVDSVGLETVIRCVGWLIASKGSDGRLLTAALLDDAVHALLRFLTPQFDLSLKLAAGESLAGVAAGVAADPMLSEKYATELQSIVLDRVEAMASLSHAESSSKKTQKRDRASQKSGFRQIRQSLQQFPAAVDEGLESFQLSFGGGPSAKSNKYTCDGWSKFLGLQLMRQLYAEGLQAQVVSGRNPLVADCLELTGGGEEFAMDHSGMSREGRRALEGQKRNQKMDITRSRFDKQQSSNFGFTD